MGLRKRAVLWSKNQRMQSKLRGRKTKEITGKVGWN